MKRYLLRHRQTISQRAPSATRRASYLLRRGCSYGRLRQRQCLRVPRDSDARSGGFLTGRVTRPDRFSASRQDIAPTTNSEGVEQKAPRFKLSLENYWLLMSGCPSLVPSIERLLLLTFKLRKHFALPK
jgi:hypothetical protein